jgi:ADP-ribose pyrophosphatase
VDDIAFRGAEQIYASERFSLAIERFGTPDGEIARPIIHHPGAVAIVAQPDPGTLLLVRQYRYSVRRWTLEIPAGTRVAGEEPRATAARELREEAGYDAAFLDELCRFHPAIGVSDEELIVYRAAALSRVPPSPDPGELVAPVVVALGDLPRLVASGGICDAKTLIAFALLGQVLPAKGCASC